MAVSTSAPTTGLLNLEKELICFICTEVLYQPLTLLDCLHTFCGSCLKEWFSHQHRKATHSRTPVTTNPYTCPTCRATVKDAQHNAMINTLLDMFLVANPDKNRSEDERAEMSLLYRPGEVILPKIEARRRDRRRHDEEEVERRERRMLDEARERSLRDIGTGPQPGARLAPQDNQHRSRSRSAENEGTRDRRIQEREERRQRRHRVEAAERLLGQGGSQHAGRDESSRSPPLSSPRHPDAVEARQRGARTVAHQASLRSIVSASDSGTGTGDSLSEVQVMQEILAEGLLEGINVDELTEAEQDELSELIAERYRQLHPGRDRRARHSQHDGNQITPNMDHLQIEEADRPQQRSHSHTQRIDSTPSSDLSSRQRENRPPTSYTIGHDREQTLSPPPTDRAHRRRASDQSGRPESSRHRITNIANGRSSATRSATDLTNNPQSETAVGRPRQLSDSGRAQTEPRQTVAATELWQHSVQRSSISASRDYDAPVQEPSSAQDTAPNPSIENFEGSPSSVPDTGASDKAMISTVQTQFQEPSISCSRCSRKNIQYDVYKHCSPCAIDLCIRCYRSERGCNHWFGFGHSAIRKFEASQPKSRHSQSMELPHVLVGRQYRRPSGIVQTDDASGQTSVVTTSDPLERLQEGNFCDRCGAFANTCFWSCDDCNEGEWGFCNDCVNTHHCCTHPLLPIAYNLSAPRGASVGQPGNGENGGAATPRISDFHASTASPSPAQSAPSSAKSVMDQSIGPRPDHVQLSILTHCDVCRKGIQPNESRVHCPTHPSPDVHQQTPTGDYDVCASCYYNLVKAGRISRTDGPAGWRKCPSGHRMIVTAFENDRDGGSRRVIINDLVGGLKMTENDIKEWTDALDQSSAGQRASERGQWTWHDPADPAADPTSATHRRTRPRQATIAPAADGGDHSVKQSKFPPDGGIGMKCIALWSYSPEEGDDGRGELTFPKYAEVREVEVINEEWSEGVYAGTVGLVPRVVVREI